MFDSRANSNARTKIVGRRRCRRRRRMRGRCWRERLGADVVVKHENHTPIGAFKVRGGLVYLDRLKRERPNTPGIISATRGNHGQSLAFAAGRHGVPAVIYVPRGNSVEKNRAMRAFGAELVEHGEDFQAAREEAERRAQFAGLHMVPSFHPDLVLGVATYALELLRDGARSRRALCADRAGLGHLRLHHGARSARAEDRNRRRAVDRSAVLRAVVRGRHGRDHRDQQHAGRRHGDPRSRCRGARDHPQGRLAHRAGHGRRGRRRRSAPTGPIRTISPKAPAQPRWPRRCRRRQNSPASASA